MQVSLDDRVILVTGAAQGIGQSCARLAARSGAAGIMLTDRNECRETERLVHEAGHAHGTETGFVEADLQDKDAPLRIVEACLARFGRVDGLVNAAGLTGRGALADATPASWDRLFTVNARAPSFLMQHCIADMAGRRSGGTPVVGAIVNILSMDIHHGADDLAIRAASGAALARITRDAAHAHRSDRIRINGINLGRVDTPGEVHAGTPVRGEDRFPAPAATQPSGRLLTPEDVARLVMFLLSDASLPMTGALIDQE